MQLLDEALCQSLLSSVDYKIDATEVVSGLDDIIHAHALALDANCVGLKDLTRLVVCQTTTFDVV